MTKDYEKPARMQQASLLPISCFSLAQYSRVSQLRDLGCKLEKVGRIGLFLAKSIWYSNLAYFQFVKGVLR